MTKLQLLVFSSLFPFLLLAQPFKGQHFLGGSIGFISQNDDVDNINGRTFLDLELSPNWGIMISDRSAIVISPNFGYQENTSNNPFSINQNKQIFRSIGLTTSYRQYLPLGLGLGFILEPFVSFNRSNGNQFIFDENNVAFTEVPINTNTFSLGISPRLYYFLSQHFAVEASLGAIFFSESNTDFDPPFTNRDQTNTFFGTNLGTELFISFNYFFGTIVED